MNYEIVAAYLAGECTEAEKREVNQWMAASPENAQEFQRYQTLWKSSRQPHEGFEPDMKKAWERIRPAEEAIAKRSLQPSVFAWLSRIAAILLVGFLLAAGLYWYRQSAVSRMAWTESVTGEGQKTRLQLTDGTVIWLNAASRLRFPKTFTGTTREVYLEGEAFFEVAKDTTQPFLIHTGPTVTRVLGTAFDVKGYAGASVEVAVVEGKVSFAQRDQQEGIVVLTPGEKAMWSPKGRQITESTNSNPNFLAWKTGRLLFRDAPLREVLPVLEQHFGVDIQAQNPALLHCRLTGTFEQARLEQILEVFAYGSGITHEKKNDTYVLDGKGCPASQ
jgi:transmembrane sensor